MKNNPTVIAVVNQKGGTGKTTTCENLGIGIALEGKKVLLIDTDPQASLTLSLGFPNPDDLYPTLSDLLTKVIEEETIKPREGVIHHKEGVDLIPANIELSGLEVSLVNAMSRETILKQYVDTVKREYDYVLLDCMPSLGMLTINALAAADHVLIPVQAQYLPAKGLEQLLQTINKVRRQINPKLRIEGVLLTMVDSRTNYGKDISTLIRETYGDKLKVFNTDIPRSVRAEEISAEGKSIFSHDPKGKVSEARDGKWNGGFAPYGYKIVDGVLEINEEEAEAIRMIFDMYANTDMGANGVAKYLENHGIRKIARQNGKYPLFSPHLIRQIINNPVYNGKIAYGRRKTEKVHGTRNEYKQVKSDDYLLVDGLHEALVDDELWNKTQLKIASQAKKYEVVDRVKNQQRHLLSGLVKCPICGTGMYGNKSIKHRKDGSKYKDFYYYGCKHRKFINGEKCTYNKQINEDVLNSAVIEILSKAVNNPKLISIMEDKINTKIDTSEIDLEIKNYEKQLRQFQLIKNNLISEIDMLDPENKHYISIKNDLNERLYSMYDKIEGVRELLNDANARKLTIEEEKLTSENIYRILMQFDKLYSKMSNDEQRKFVELIIEEIHIYEERQANGQWIKSIHFKLPIVEDLLNVGLDKNSQVETVCLLSRGK